MKTLQLLLVVALVLLYGCDRDNNTSGYSYNGYPTVYFKMESSELQQLQNTYFELNPFTKSGLDGFGFCGLEESDLNRTIEYPPDPHLTAVQARNAVMDFLSQNSRFTGVKNPQEMSFYNTDSFSTVWDSSLVWSLRSTNQFFNGIEVYYSGISFHLWHGKMQYCEGNWYPDIKIPAPFRIDSTAAKQQLVGREVTYFSWSGPYYATVSKSDIEKSTAKTVIFPVKDDNAIVLYVTWEVNVPAPIFCRFYIDVMTGNIISEQPTIIS